MQASLSSNNKFKHKPIAIALLRVWEDEVTKLVSFLT